MRRASYVDRHRFEVHGRVALTGKPARFENFSTPRARWWDVYAFPIRGSRRVAILFRNISDHKRAKETLRESEARLRELNLNPRSMD
jgi:PAS domain-containing protein